MEDLIVYLVFILWIVISQCDIARLKRRVDELEDRVDVRPEVSK